MALVIEGGLGEQAGELDLAGVGLAVFAFAGAAFGLGCYHGNAGAINGDVEHVRQRCGRREGHHLAGADRVSLRGDGLAGRGAVGFGGPLDPLGGQDDPGQLGEQAAGLGERDCGRRAGCHRPRPGDMEARATPSSASLGTTPCPQPAQWY